MKYLISSVGLLALLLSGNTLAEEAASLTPSNSDPESIKKDNVTTNTSVEKPKVENKPAVKVVSDIYDINLNNNWKFSGLVTFDGDNIYIPLRFIPPNVLGNLTETNLIEKNGTRNLGIKTSSIVKKDDENLTLEINLTEDYFKTQIVKVDQIRQRASVPIDALYMNYDINFTSAGIQDTRGTFKFNWASKDNWSLTNDMLWDGTQAVRLDTTWKKTLADNNVLILGDTNGNSLSGFNSLNFLGFRYATSYFNNTISLEKSLPTIPLSGFAVNPSRLDLYINNQLLQKSEIASGRYNLEVPFQNRGYGVAQAYVYDITGKPTIVSVPFYSNSEILKKGAHEYDVSGGLIRKDFGSDSFSYDKPIVNLLYKGGWLNDYTQDIYVQASQEYSAVSFLGHVVPYKPLGMFNIGYSYNSEGQSLYRFGMERVTSSLSFGMDYQQSNLFCFGFGQNCLKNQKQIYAGTALPWQLGSINMSYVSRETDTNVSNITSLQWNRQLGKNISMFASLSKLTGSSDPNTTVYVGLSMSLGNNFYGNTSFTQDKSGLGIQQGFYVSEDDKNPKRGYGSVTLNKTPSDQTANVYYGARLKNFAYQTNIYQDGNGVSGSANVSGAVAYIPSENYVTFSKQIQSGLTYVKINNMTEPAEISHENRVAGYSDNQGRFLVTDSISNNNETISIDINRLPNGITLDNYKKEYYVPSSGATRVEFNAKPLPYSVKINNVKSGAIFSIGEDYYVVGENGMTSLDNVGKAVIPLQNGRVCNLEFKTGQREYTCPKSDEEVKAPAASEATTTSIPNPEVQTQQSESVPAETSKANN